MYVEMLVKPCVTNRTAERTPSQLKELVLKINMCEYEQTLFTNKNVMSNIKVFFLKKHDGLGQDHWRSESHCYRSFKRSCPCDRGVWV